MILPPGLPVVHGPRLTEELAAWAAARIEGCDGFGACWAVGVLSRGALGAVVVFHNYRPQHGTVELSCAAERWHGVRREVLGHILGVAFLGKLGAPVRKVWTLTPHTSERALRMNERMGFKREAILSEQMAPKVHAVICAMKIGAWQRLYGGHDGRQSTASA